MYWQGRGAGWQDVWPSLRPPEMRSVSTPPVLVPDTQLLGRYESEGITDERYLIRRGDGQVLLLTMLLWLVVTDLDRHQSLETIAQKLSERIGQEVSVGEVQAFIDAKLRPLGIITGGQRSEPVTVTTSNKYVGRPFGHWVPPAPQERPVETKRMTPLLSLTLKGTLVPARVVRCAATVLCPLYQQVVVLAALAAFIGSDVWLYATHGVGNSFADLTTKPLLFLPMVGMVLGSGLFHEFGHATACKKGGGMPGRIGYGVMLFLPAFYTDVTDAYRLDKKSRLRTDIGGIYFNAISIIALTAIYAGTHYLPIIPAIVLIHLTMVQQLLPIIRLDGYYLLSDLVGVPDLFGRIKPILLSWFGRKDPRGGQLAPSARRVVTAWIAVTVPLLLVSLGLFLVHLPNFLRASWRGLKVQWELVNLAYQQHVWSQMALSAVDVAILLIPLLGISALLLRGLKRLTRIKPHQRYQPLHTKKRRTI